MGESVTGGVGGIQACLDDLVAFSLLLISAAATVSEVEQRAELARSELAGLDFGPNNHHRDDIVDELSRSAGCARHLFDELHVLGIVVRAAAEYYAEADGGILSAIVAAIVELPGAVLHASESLFFDLDPMQSLAELITADPEIVEVITGVLRPIGAVAYLMDDGRPIVTESGGGVVEVASAPPNSVSDLVAELSEASKHAAGEISVSFVCGAGATRRVIVDIPGTRSWSPLPTSDITSLVTNLRAVQGEQTSYEAGVLQAMREAGVTSQDDVMLVGHSEGGMIAVNAARDATRSGDFHISHVVTAGAPVGRTVASLPRSVQVLALEGRGDVVTRLDGAPNPDRLNVTTVTGGPNRHSVSDNHSLDDTYQSLARSVDANDNESIRAFVDSADDFLHQDLMLTQRYTITRGY